MSALRRYFKPDPDFDGSNWIIAWFGRDGGENKDYNLTTNLVHASELTTISTGAGGDCRLVADLLNWYHNDQAAVKTINAFVKRMNDEERRAGGK